MPISSPSLNTERPTHPLRYGGDVRVKARASGTDAIRQVRPATQSNCGKPVKLPVPPRGSDARGGTRAKARPTPTDGRGTVKTWKMQRERENRQSATKCLRFRIAGPEHAAQRSNGCGLGPKRPGLRYDLISSERTPQGRGRRPPSLRSPRRDRGPGTPGHRVRVGQKLGSCLHKSAGK
jgi:hypothetical protein